MLRIALAQFRPRKAAYEDNLARAGEVFRAVAGWAEPPELLVFPETALTGYFVEGGTRDLAVSAEQLHRDLSARHAASGAPPMDVAIGFYEVWRSRLYNSGLYTRLGDAAAGIRHVHRKVFLPTYGVFDEERFVEAGRSVEAFDTGWGRAAILICEDAWHSITPMLAALDGAQLVLVLSASPARGILPREGVEARPSNVLRWERLAQDIAEEHGVYVAVPHLVGFEGGKAFAGGSVLAGPRGDVILRGPLFEETILAATLDFDEITRARAEQPLLADLELKLPHLLPGYAGPPSTRNGADGGPPSPSATAATAPRTHRREGVTCRPADLAIDPELTRRWLVEFLRDEVRRRRGFDRVVVGLSGGVDSALVAFLAAEALGPENVTAVRMPYRTSSRDSLDHAQLVVDRLGIHCRTVDISQAVDGLTAAIGGETTPSRRGNVMARMRMIILFDLSAELHALPVGTGNKTERLLGYFTWHADDSPPVNPIGDLFKTQVWALARHVGVPEVIIEKPATADLIIGQTDEGDLGVSYPRADAILAWLLAGHRPADIVAMGCTAEEVALVSRRLESTHWKRRLPTVAMVSQTAIGEWYLRPVDF